MKVIQRCMLMTTYPGDIVFDPTCGSGTTAFVAEQWGRRWITCDTSRVATTLAKQRLMTATFDYYKLAYADEGVGSGFQYKKVPHITLKSIANNEPPATETLYDQPLKDTKKARVTGPFTVEAVSAPTVQPIDDITAPETVAADETIARSGATLRQNEWRDELLKTGIRSLFPSQVFFPMSDAKSGWYKLAKNLKAEIDEELIEAYRGTVSIPFTPGKNERIAVKIVDDRGIESLRVVGISEATAINQQLENRR